MNAQHTPGPWQRSGVRRKLGAEDCLQVGPDGAPIAFLPIGRLPNEHAGAIADASLIAAAPDLMDACEDALGALNGAEYALPAHVVAALERAIAKAKTTRSTS